MRFLKWLWSLLFKTAKAMPKKTKYTREEYIADPLIFRADGIFFSQFKDPIMEKWEEPYIREYMRRILDKYKPETVLETGFGYGYTSDEIQKYGVKKHIIVEAHPAIYKNLEAWAKDKPNVIPVYAFVEDFKYPEGVDLLFHDAHPRTSYPWALDTDPRPIPFKNYINFDAVDMMKMSNFKTYETFYNTIKQWQ